MKCPPDTRDHKQCQKTLPGVPTAAIIIIPSEFLPFFRNNVICYPEKPLNYTKLLVRRYISTKSAYGKFVLPDAPTLIGEPARMNLCCQTRPYSYRGTIRIKE